MNSGKDICFVAVKVFFEAKTDGRPVIGDLKHWHVFHIIARGPKTWREEV